MDYIQVGDPNWILLLAAVGVIAIGVAGLVISLRVARVNSSFDPVGHILTGACVISVILSLLLIGAFTVPSHEQKNLAAEQVNKTYGLSLTGEDIQELEYPEKEPTGTFQVFGSIPMDSPTETGFTRTENFLIWKDGAMMLAQSDNGEGFSELPKD